MTQWLADHIVVLLVLAAVAGAGLAIAYERRRRQRLVAGYEGLGFERLPEAHLAPLMGPDRFWLLARAGWWRSAELARGQWRGQEVVQFRLTLPDAIGRRQHQTATLIRHAAASTPFHLRPETLRDRMGNAMGETGIDYPALSRYTDAYCTDGDGADTAEALLPEQLLTYLQRDTGWCLEARGGHLLVFQAHNLVREPRDIEKHLDKALWIQDVLVNSGNR